MLEFHGAFFFMFILFCLCPNGVISCERKTNMIAILKMKVFADFDEQYDVNVAAGNRDKIVGVCRVLNNFCEFLPGCEQDVELSKYLEDKEYAERLSGMLNVLCCFSTRKAIEFVELLKRLCEGPRVYVYKDTFTVEEIVQL